jgi:hypothetical protein
LATAIAPPMTQVPAYNVAAVPADRTAMPATSSRSAANSARSMPKRCARPAANGETAANASSGSVVSRPAADAFNAKLARTASSSGPSTVIGARRLAAMQRMPMTSSAGWRCDRTCEVEECMVSKVMLCGIRIYRSHPFADACRPTEDSQIRSK